MKATTRQTGESARRAYSATRMSGVVIDVQAAIDRWMVDSAGTGRCASRDVAQLITSAASIHHRTNRQHDAGDARPARRGRGKSSGSLALIDAARAILQEIHPASIRAVCYRLFVLKLIPSMARASTSRVSRQLTYAREQGLLPWEWVVDETREPERVQAFENPAAYVEVVKTAYRRDRWADQPHSVEVWSEKGTIRGTLAPVLHAYGITFRVMHGFASSTTVHQIAEETQRATKPLTVFYAGDWDPSGLHMSAVDLPSRLARYGGQAHLVRTALVEGDLADLPSFSAETKRADPRYRWFRQQHGETCWELDALNPVVLRDRIERAIVDLLDHEAWDRAAVAERAECESLETVLQAWPGISSRGSKCSSALVGPAERPRG